MKRSPFSHEDPNVTILIIRLVAAAAIAAGAYGIAGWSGICILLGLAVWGITRL